MLSYLHHYVTDLTFPERPRCRCTRYALGSAPKRESCWLPCRRRCCPWRIGSKSVLLWLHQWHPSSEARWHQIHCEGNTGWLNYSCQSSTWNRWEASWLTDDGEFSEASMVGDLWYAYSNMTCFIYLSPHHYFNQTGGKRGVNSIRFPGDVTGKMSLYVTCPIKLENTKTPVKKLVIWKVISKTVWGSLRPPMLIRLRTA